jgi:hypothetical protein
VNAPDSYVDLSGEVDLGSDDLYDSADRLAASAERAMNWPAFWVVAAVLLFPPLLVRTYPLLERGAGEIMAWTLVALLVAGGVGHAVVRLISVPRVAQYIASGAIVVFLGAMIAASLTGPFSGSDSGDGAKEERAQAHTPRSLELSHDYTTLTKLDEQHDALKRRVGTLGLDPGGTIAERLDAATENRRRAIDQHAPGAVGKVARHDGREWATQLRACRHVLTYSVRVDAAAVTCR